MKRYRGIAIYHIGEAVSAFLLWPYASADILALMVSIFALGTIVHAWLRVYDAARGRYAENTWRKISRSVEEVQYGVFGGRVVVALFVGTGYVISDPRWVRGGFIAHGATAALSATSLLMDVLAHWKHSK